LAVLRPPSSRRSWSSAANVHLETTASIRLLEDEVSLNAGS
jgi:hypothetical protein